MNPIFGDITALNVLNFDEMVWNSEGGVPTVTTQDATDVTSISCTGNGNITDIGTDAPTVRGFCYKTGATGAPTTSDSTVYETGTFSTGAYSLSITGLSTDTSYRIRAYATNSDGTGYGDTVQILTNSKQNVSQVVTEVSTEFIGTQNVSQIVTEVSSLNNGYQSLSQLVVEVAYTIKPTVISFDPAEGVAGDEITITGTNFAYDAVVTFNGVAATIKTNVPTEIVAIVPALASTGKIAVDTVESLTDFVVITYVRYWIGNTGYWTDTAHWSTTSGGVGGASVPTAGTDVFIDSNSFTEPGHHIEFE
jgi:hypothetical protein